MKFIFKVFLVFSGLAVFTYYVVPNDILPSYFILNSIILFLMCSFSIYLALRRTNNTLTSGIILIGLQFLFMFIGSINYYIVIYIFPDYTEGMEVTQLYWMGCSLLFIVGYLIALKKSRTFKPLSTYIPANLVPLIWFFVILGFIGTVLGIINVGHIPVLTKGSGFMRYTGEEGMGGIETKLWMLNLIAGLFSFMYYQKSKKPIYLIVYLFSVLQLTVFIIRFYFILSLLLAMILYLGDKSITRGLIIRIAVIFIFLGFLNTFYLENRSGNENLLVMRSGRNLNDFQSRYIYSTFNEFRQLNDLIARYPDRLYGQTFLSIPISFLPSEFWDAFGINKTEIQNLNSAILLTEVMETGGGLRTGITGELFVNFGFAGALFMIPFGYFMGYLDNLYRRTSRFDLRKLFLLIFIGIFIYATFVGQINAVGSLIVFYLYIFIAIYFLFRKKNLKVQEVVTTS